MLLDQREKEREMIEAWRFRVLVWIGVLSLLSALIGVVLTAIQTFR